MMVETFGKRICRLRKQANMTQRELANLLGISEPAVCKWETDSSMPDVMLLAPLARALHTDLNTLFLYEEILSPEKVKELADSAEEAGRTNGTEAGMQYWKEVLQEYPNSELLQMTFAKWLMKLQVQRVATKEQLTKLEDLLVKLCKSEELEISTEAKRYLASFYIQNQRYEEAENMLDALSEFDFNARHLRALLLYVQKNYEAATKEAEQFLFECVQNALICLSRLAGVAVAIEDAEKERTYAEMMCRIEEEFGIPFYRGAMQMREYYLRSGEEEKAKECIEKYAEHVKDVEKYFENSPFFSDLGEDLRYISNGALVSLEDFREEVLQMIQKILNKK
ncbi:MAG: helix-turn-helix transcriptional regulator [Lachnospiraceae bacterium]|nr:helix-turn-helix transcriptional regulator [Lachnospiraceae bacterium]